MGASEPTVVRLQVTVEEVDRATIGQLQNELADALRRYQEGPHLAPDRPGGALVVDLSSVRFLDSSGIRALLDADRVAGRHGGRITVTGANEGVRRALEVTGVWEHLAPAG